jgi:hypothetical protein
MLTPVVAGVWGAHRPATSEPTANTPRPTTSPALSPSGCRTEPGVITGQVLYACGGKSVYAYLDWTN